MLSARVMWLEWFLINAYSCVLYRFYVSFKLTICIYHLKNLALSF